MVDGQGAFGHEQEAGWEGHGVEVWIVDGHVAFEKEEDSGWGVRWGWLMARGLLQRNKRLVGRVRVSKW
jgi:hypothetical protein